MIFMCWACKMKQWKDIPVIPLVIGICPALPGELQFRNVKGKRSKPVMRSCSQYVDLSLSLPEQQDIFATG